MPMERASTSIPHDRTASSATEYRERFMSPRREDYIPPVVVPKVGSARASTNRSFLCINADEKDPTLKSSEYRLCFPNHHPKRPYVFHAQPSHVFDHVPMPLSAKVSSRLSASMTSLKDTEYQDRFPNYRAYIPTRELLPAHIPPRPNVLSDTQAKRDRMDRSVYFQQLVSEDDKLHGGQRYFGNSEQRASFQWPYRNPYQQRQVQQAQQEMPVQIYPPYYVPRNIYEPMPTIQRTAVNTTN